MKCYTIIDSFEIDGIQEMWVANYADKGEAQKCFDYLMKKYGVDGNFDELLTNGNGFEYFYGSEHGTLFVRGEEIQSEFNPDEMPS